MSDPTAPTFDDQLEALGFRARSMSRRGGRRWDRPVNRVLTFTLPDDEDHVVLTGTCALGQVFAEREWRASAASDASAGHPTREISERATPRMPVPANTRSTRIVTRVVNSGVSSSMT